MAISSKRFDRVSETTMSICFLDWLGANEWTRTQSRIAILSFPLWALPYLALVFCASVALLLILPFAFALDQWNRD